jgi:hypothetical protein
MAFQPGQSGNPGGRPKGADGVRDLARQHTEAAVEALAHIARYGEKEAARVAAATALLDRAWGKPTQSVEHSTPDGTPFPVGITVTFVKPDAG